MPNDEKQTQAPFVAPQDTEKPKEQVSTSEDQVESMNYDKADWKDLVKEGKDRGIFKVGMKKEELIAALRESDQEPSDEVVQENPPLQDEKLADQEMEEDVNAHLKPLTPDELKELSIGELYGMAEKMNIPNLHVYTTKEQFVSVISLIQATSSQRLPSEPSDDREVNKKWTSKRKRMMAILLKDERVPCYFPLESKKDIPGIVVEKLKGNGEVYFEVDERTAFDSVIINGCQWVFPLGRQCSLPKRVAEHKRQSQEATDLAGREFLMDRSETRPDMPYTRIIDALV